MGKKCSVGGCKTGYKTDPSKAKISIYSFPKDHVKCREWVARLPNILDADKVTSDMGICALHWPEDVPKVKSARHLVPAVPPSIFPNVPQSFIPSSTRTTPRPTKRATQQARLQPEVDQMEEFLEKDSLCQETFSISLNAKFKDMCFVATWGDQHVLMSHERSGPTPHYCIYMQLVRRSDNRCVISYDGFRSLKKLLHPSIKEIKSWSQLEEVVRYVRTYTPTEQDQKINFLSQMITLVNVPKNTRLYNSQDLLLAFSWYTQSRSLYLKLRTYLQLPSVSTMKRITAVAKNKEDEELFASVFRNQDKRSRFCVLIVDEVYVKASISYRGGTVFGMAVDQPDKVATTLLCIMVKCFFGGQTFLSKILPCHALTSDFQYKQILAIITSLEKSGATVVAIINDNNRVNQSFFNKFAKPDSAAPWKADSPTAPGRPLFLLYDTVHLIKNLRNNWLSEKTKTLEVKLPQTEDAAAASKILVGKWTDLEELFENERKYMVKLSTLTKAAVCPNNIEKQKVSLVLNVFSEKTVAALRSSSSTNQSWKDTADFIEHILRLWKVFNTKTPRDNVCFRDNDRTAVDLSDTGHLQIDILQLWAKCASSMKPSGGQRVRSLTADTASALHWTCSCLIELCQYLLTIESELQHKYVTIGFFQQDDIEHHFAHFRMCAGSNYYITVQDVSHTHAMDRAKLMLENESSVDYSSSQHACSLCEKCLSDEELLVLDDLAETAVALSHDERMALFFIGGYVAFKHPELKGEPSAVPQDLSPFINSLNRGGLSFPCDALYQLLVFAYAFIMATSKETNCRQRLITIFRDFPAMFHIDIIMNNAVLSRIVNILMKRCCLYHEIDNKQMQRRKVAKLSSASF